MGRVGKKLKMKWLKISLSTLKQLKFGKMDRERKILYYFPHLFVEGEVKLPIGTLTPFQTESNDLKIRHEEFNGGSVFKLNGMTEISKFDRETDFRITKAVELLKFSYFSKSVPHAVSPSRFVSLETFDMFRLIENHVDNSFEHKIVVSNGMSEFSHSADKVLLSRKNQAVNSIYVNESNFDFDLTDSLESLDKKSELYSVVHLYNKAWELQSLFNSFLDKPILAKTTFEVLYEYNGGKKKQLSSFASNFVEMIYSFVEEHKNSELALTLINMTKAHKDEMVRNIDDALNHLKNTRDSLVHEGSQDFDTSAIKFYMVWFPIYWSLTINRESLTKEHAFRFLCFLCLCKHLPSTWDNIEFSDKPPYSPKYSHLACYVMKSNQLANNLNDEYRNAILKSIENWLKEN
ncbi:hypothetical protein D0812_07065 [Vibrio owensii]|uniref:Apea-like HEPN domain-containing protein n=1 Tax=Vibrio owensii TaxID=696485 RepID=A0AAP9GBK2_9VIBR|nr:hypothetical protein [Vibrio owensii]AYO14187.1 hypothetical protein D0812_07065 [Vibrio owensii]QGH46837.1 hypothetical protein APZ19_06870 [Vibrio owensii]